MTTSRPKIIWKTLPNWQTASLIGFGIPGLFRFRLNSEIMFIAYAATAKTGIGPAILAYRRGGRRNHYAGALIFENLHDLELQYCALDLPAHEIRKLHADLIEKHQPEWNVPNDYRRR